METAIRSPKLFEIVVRELAMKIEDNLNMAIRHPRFEEKFLSQAAEAERQYNWMHIPY
jgi:hypothetical protein